MPEAHRRCGYPACCVDYETWRQRLLECDRGDTRMVNWLGPIIAVAALLSVVILISLYLH
jgi:hypothetical protein